MIIGKLDDIIRIILMMSLKKSHGLSKLMQPANLSDREEKY